MSSYEKCIRSEKISDTEWLYGVIDVIQRTDIFDSILDEEIEQIYNSRKRKYVSHNRSKDLWATPWGLMLKNVATINDATAYEHRKFRRRFRVPFDMFTKIVKECTDRDIFVKENTCRI